MKATVRNTIATALVVASQSSPKDKTLKERARQVTMRLFYTLPIKHHQLKMYEASAFVLYCEPMFDEYINRFQPQVSSYEYYVEKIICRRMKAFLIYNQKQDKFEHLCIHNQDFFLEDNAFNEAPLYGIESVDLSKMPSLFNYLVKPSPHSLSHPTIKQEYIISRLRNKSDRKSFLLFLTTQPFIVLRNGTLQKCCNLFGTSKEILGSYFCTADDQLKKKRMMREKREKNIRYHFALSIYAQNERKYHDLSSYGIEKAKQREINNKRIYLENSEYQQKNILRLSHGDIAMLVGLPLGTVNGCIHNAKKMIMMAMDVEKAKPLSLDHGYIVG